MRRYKYNKKGFTLVELIIVIAVLAILAAILVPSTIGYITEANTTACTQNAQEISRLYTYRSGLLLSKGESKSGIEILKSEIDTAYSGSSDIKITSESSSQLKYSGICPAGGIYTLSFPDGNLTCTCSEHGRLIGNFTIEDMADKMLDCSELINFLNANRNRIVQLDSTSPGGTGFNGTTQKLVAELQKAFGIDLSSGSWRIYKNANSDEVQFYWAPENISGKTPGTAVEAQKYIINYKTGVATPSQSGTVKIKTNSNAGKTYNIIDNSSFTAA